MFKREKLQLFIFIVLVALQVMGIIGLLGRFHLAYLPVMLVIFFFGGICTTLYLHRYLTHRGFEMPEWLKFMFATGSAVTLAGDPVTWVGDHRYHHLKSDTDEDIHSPMHGFPYAHMMWLVRKPREFRERSRRYAADVREDLVLPSLGKSCPLCVAAFDRGRLALFRVWIFRNALVLIRADAVCLQCDLGSEFYLPHAVVRLQELRDHG